MDVHKRALELQIECHEKDQRIAELEAELNSALAAGRRWYDSDRQRMVMVMEANQKRRAAEAKLAMVREAINPNNGCECEFHACDDMPCTWCGTFMERIDAILSDTHKPIAVVAGWLSSTDVGEMPWCCVGDDLMALDIWNKPDLPTMPDGSVCDISETPDQPVTVIVLPKEVE